MRLARPRIPPERTRKWYPENDAWECVPPACPVRTVRIEVNPKFENKTAELRPAGHAGSQIILRNRVRMPAMDGADSELRR